MPAAYRKTAASGAFFGAYEQLHEMEEHLRSVTAFANDHAELETYVRQHGREVERRTLQAHLDLRAACERPIDVRGADGVRHTTRRQWSRRLLTVVGMVEIKRWAYEAKGVDTLYPADAALNLPDDLYSFGVRHLVAEEACKISFDEVVEQTEKVIGVAVPKRQVEQLTMRAARDFTAFYATRAVQVEDTTALLVFGFNGKGVIMRHEDLREGTKKAAEKSKHKLQTRLTQGEKRNRKRMAQVATIYTVAPWVRTPMDILHDLRSVRPVATPRPRPVNKRVWASLEMEPKTVIAEAFAEGLRRDPEQKRHWVVLVDGHRDQLRWVKRTVKKARVEVTIVLDLIHVLEYFWKAAHCFPQGRQPGVGAVGPPAPAGAAAGTCGGGIRQGPPSLGRPVRTRQGQAEGRQRLHPLLGQQPQAPPLRPRLGRWVAACVGRDRGRVPASVAGSAGHHGRAVVAARRRSCAQAARPAFQRRLRGVLGLPHRAGARPKPRGPLCEQAGSWSALAYQADADSLKPRGFVPNKRAAPIVIPVTFRTQ